MISHSFLKGFCSYSDPTVQTNILKWTFKCQLDHVTLNALWDVRLNIACCLPGKCCFTVGEVVPKLHILWDRAFL